MKKYFLIGAIFLCFILSMVGIDLIYIAMVLSFAAGILGLINYQTERKRFIQHKGIQAAKGYWKTNYKKWLDSVLIIIATMVMVYLQISGFYDNYQIALIVSFLLIGFYLFNRENKKSFIEKKGEL